LFGLSGLGAVGETRPEGAPDHLWDFSLTEGENAVYPHYRFARLFARRQEERAAAPYSGGILDGRRGRLDPPGVEHEPAGLGASGRPAVGGGAYCIGRDEGGTRLIRTFHIGNSLTDTLDGWLKPVAESAGHPLDFHRFTIPGAPTDWLWSHPASGFGDSRYAEAIFAFAPFDAIITQPFAGHGRSVENEAEYSD